MNKKETFIAVVKKYFRKDEVFLIPNVLCYLRVILIIIFLCLYLNPFSIAGNVLAHIYLAAAVMVLAAYTDFLDGLIARKFNQVSQLGKIIDPIADKLLQLSVAIGICYQLYSFPIVFVMLSFFIFKEFVLFIQNIILAQHNKSFGSAHWYGKVSTFIFYVILCVLLVASPFIIQAYGMDSSTTNIIINSLCGFVLIALFFSFIMYNILFAKILRHGPDEVDLSEVKNGGEKDD